jgi:hypothetical protein
MKDLESLAGAVHADRLNAKVHASASWNDSCWRPGERQDNCQTAATKMRKLDLMRISSERAARTNVFFWQSGS